MKHETEMVGLAIGQMSQAELSELADYLVEYFEGRGVKLATFIDFAHQDKSMRAAEEEGYYKPDFG